MSDRGDLPLAGDEDAPGEPPDGPHPHVLVTDVAAPALDDDALHHLGRVRRLRTGAPCTVSDGAGAWRWCRFTGGHDLEPDGAVVQLPRPAPELTVAIALTKAHKPDWTVQKLTELGVDRIVVFRADRSVARWDREKATTQLHRLRAIVASAVEQSQRCWLPTVEPPLTTVAELARRGAVRVERGGGPPRRAHHVVAVGPEGGWSDTERGQLPETMGLGAHVLRAETAALTAGALMISLRSGIVAERRETLHAG